MQRFLLLAGCCLFSLLLHAQNYSYDGFLEAGDKAVEANDHYNAMKFYEAALAFKDEDEQDPEVHFKMGQQAYEASAYVLAQNALSRVVGQLPPNNGGTTPLARFYLGMVYLRQGNYADATTQLDDFLAQNPSPNTRYQEMANRALGNAHWAAGEIDNDRDINLRHLGNVINTPDSDFGYTVRPDGSALYSSHNYTWKKDTLRPLRNLSRIRKVVSEEMVMPLPELINVPNKIVATSTFNAAGTRVYYSICEYRDALNEFDAVRCDLYRANVGEDNRWTDPVALDINMEGYSTAMPSVGTDISTNLEYLYFSSDRPGGEGKMDIWRAPLNEDGSAGTPVNLGGDINTEGLDVTPFFYTAGQTLYFSTDGRLSLGGLDLHKSYSSSNGFSTPVNLGAPVNSSYEDAYYSRFEEDKAFLSTSRPSAYNVSYDKNSDVCCYDIYEFVPDDGIKLDVLTYVLRTGEPLNGTTVELYEITPEGEVLLSTLTNDDSNDYHYEIERGKIYEVRGHKDGFTGDIDRFDLNDPEFVGLDVITRELFLDQVFLDVYTYNRANGDDLPNTAVHLYEIAGNGAETLIDTKSDPGSNHVTFQLAVGKNYRVDAERDDFGASTTEQVDLTNYPPTAPGRIRKDLYLGQLLRVFVIDGNTNLPLNGATVSLGFVDGDPIATETKPNSNRFEYIISLDQFFDLQTRRDEYIPDPRQDVLTFTQADLVAGDGVLEYTVPLFRDDICNALVRVFFDNDLPDSNTLRVTTRTAYDDTFYDYEVREPAFIRGYSQGADDVFEAEIEVEDFFSTQLRGGFARLEALAQQVYSHVQAGGSFNMQFRGFTSPRAPSQYNINLSKRRNNSILNYFERWKGGKLKAYFGTQIFILDPIFFGEDGPGEPPVSDSYEDVQQSIYSPTASLRRRVEVIGSCPEGEESSTNTYRK